jgi:hypothetical protein
VNGACHLAENTRHEELTSNHTMPCPAYNDRMRNQDEQNQVVASYSHLPIECHEETHSTYPIGEEPILKERQETRSIES